MAEMCIFFGSKKVGAWAEDTAELMSKKQC